METHHTKYNKTISQEKHWPQPFYQQISFLGGWSVWWVGGGGGISLSCANGGMGGKSINPGKSIND